MKFSLGGFLDFIIPIGIFAFLFFIFYSNIPLFKNFIDATIRMFKEQITGVKEVPSKIGGSSNYEITYG